MFEMYLILIKILFFLFTVTSATSKQLLLEKIQHYEKIKGSCSKMGKVTKFYFHKDDWNTLPAETKNCASTCRKVDKISEADLILWHIHTQLPPNDLKPSQILLAFGLEPKREIDRFSYSRINLTSSFRFEHDIVYPYVDDSFYKHLSDGNIPSEEEFKKMKEAVFINTHCVPERDEFVKNLMKNIKVENRGKCLNNAPRIPGTLGNIPDHIRNKYKFYIAIESKRVPYYVSEKLLVGYLANAIPIYFGADEADIFAPNNSFIRVQNLSNYQFIASKINEISQNYTKWREIMESRRMLSHEQESIREWVSANRKKDPKLSDLCRFCDYSCSLLANTSSRLE